MFRNSTFKINLQQRWIVFESSHEILMSQSQPFVGQAPMFVTGRHSVWQRISSVEQKFKLRGADKCELGHHRADLSQFWLVVRTMVIRALIKMNIWTDITGMLLEIYRKTVTVYHSQGTSIVRNSTIGFGAIKSSTNWRTIQVETSTTWAQ